MQVSNAQLIRLFASVGTWGVWTYIAIFARSIGIDDVGIALVSSINALVIFFSMYAFGRLADRIGRRPLISLGLMFSVFSFFLYIYAKDFTGFLFVRLLSGISLSVYSAALIAYAHDLGQKLGKFTSFDALGGALIIPVAGLVAFYFNIVSIFILSAVLLIVALLISMKTENTRFKPLKVPLFPYKVLKQNLAVYITFFIRRSASHAVWVFWGLYMLQFTDNLFLIGIVTAINAVTQFFVMYMITDKINVIKLISLGTLLSAVTFFVYGIAMQLWHILLAQVLIGFSWSFLYIGSIRWITDRIKEKATGLGLLNSIESLSTLIGPLIALALIPFGDYRLIMFAAAAIAFGSFIAFDILAKTK